LKRDCDGGHTGVCSLGSNWWPSLPKNRLVRRIA
jgi:hypothetical protein